MGIYVALRIEPLFLFNHNLIFIIKKESLKMIYKACLTIIFVWLLAGCAIHAGSLSRKAAIIVPLKLSEPLPKINNPTRLVREENALSRWLVLYKKATKKE